MLLHAYYHQGLAPLHLYSTMKSDEDLLIIPPSVGNRVDDVN